MHVEEQELGQIDSAAGSSRCKVLLEDAQTPACSTSTRVLPHWSCYLCRHGCCIGEVMNTPGTHNPEAHFLRNFIWDFGTQILLCNTVMGCASSCSGPAQFWWLDTGGWDSQSCPVTDSCCWPLTQLSAWAHSMIYALPWKESRCDA